VIRDIAKDILQKRSFVYAVRVKEALECRLVPQDYTEWRRDLDAEIVFTFALFILWEKALTLSQTESSEVLNALENMGGEIPTILTLVSQFLESGEDVKIIREHGLAHVESIPKVNLLKEKVNGGLYTRTRRPNTIVMPKGKVRVSQ
jgi:hypothetical protein